MVNRNIRGVAACAALLALSACESITGPGGAQPLMEELPRALTVHEREVIRANNTFAFNLLRETLRAQPAANVFLSPVSASMALGMTMNGAAGATFDGMRDALAFHDIALDDINTSYRDLIKLLRELDSSVDMRIANSIWTDREFPVHDSFFQTARTYFDAEATALDFRSSGAARTINGWVDRSTGGRIKEIVPDPIPAQVVMYLINAIYFKGDWRHSFDRSATKDAPFTLEDDSQTTVKMMNRTGPARHAHMPHTGESVLELLYGRGAYAMTVVMPRQGESVDDLIASLNADRWNAWIDALGSGDLQVGLPRFRLEYESNLNSALISMGMGAAFRQLPGTDFSRLSPLGDQLYISRVLQKTFVDVNEEGTEAAAVTAVEMGLTSAGPRAFVANRPFLVAIRERFSGTILFLGKVGHPGA